MAIQTGTLGEFLEARKARAAQVAERIVDHMLKRAAASRPSLFHDQEDKSDY